MGRADLAGRVLQGTYRIERLLGQGGMGAVYQASHLRVAKRFAIKVLSEAVVKHPEALARFRREAEITSALGHPHILMVLDFNHTEDGAPYIVMEYLEGEDLAERIERVGRLALPQAASIFRQVASALAAAHEQNVIHRDLKPQNIFLCRRGETRDFAKVVDFGMSKVLGSETQLTATNTLIGTPVYMAPEQAEERLQDIDQRTDVYAMGVIVYEMLAGQSPFRGETVIAILYKIVHGQAPLLGSLCPGLPERLETIVHTAISKDPADRYDSIKAFWHDFSAVLREEQIAFFEPTEDRSDLLRTGSDDTRETEPPPDALLAPDTLRDEPRAPPALAADHARTAAPAVGTRSTLSRSVGESFPASPPSAGRRRRLLPLVALAASSAIAAAAIFFGVRPGDEPRGLPEPRAMPTAKPETAADSTVRAAADAGAAIAGADSGATAGAAEAGAPSRPSVRAARRSRPRHRARKRNRKKPRRRKTHRRKTIGDGIMDL